MRTKDVKIMGPELFEDQRRHWEEASAAMQAHLERLMQEKDSEGLEELYERFVRTEYAYIPVPGLYRGKPVSNKEFKRHAARRHEFVYGGFFKGLREALELTEREQAEIAPYYFLREPTPTGTRLRVWTGTPSTRPW
jgi:hypothetical protein